MVLVEPGVRSEQKRAGRKEARVRHSAQRKGNHLQQVEP